MGLAADARIGLRVANYISVASHVELMGVRTVRSQGAMEYLMTYGWAVVIIGVVLAALFSLGVFNSSMLGSEGFGRLVQSF